MSWALPISVGRAQLRPTGLIARGMQTVSEGRVPGRATFSGMDYQLTGLGEKVTTIEAVTYPLVTDGLDALGWLQMHHEQQAVVNYLRLGKFYLGQLVGSVVIRNLDVAEDAPHPFTGVGRKVEVAMELVHVGPGINATDLAGQFFGGTTRAL